MAVDPETAPVAEVVERAEDRYTAHGNSIVHELTIGELSLSARMRTELVDNDAKGSWWLGYLAGKRPEAIESLGCSLRTVDLFCGPGGLANGVGHLCSELGVPMISEFIADQDEDATVVYSANHASRFRSSESTRTLIDYNIRQTSTSAKFTYRPEIMDAELGRTIGGVDLVLAGPPCQGHSNLNNQTRRIDPRNSLYLTVPAFAVAAGASMCIIENVPSVVNDRQDVVTTAMQLLESEGYFVTTGILSASMMGWPQTRRRHFLVARRDRAPIPLEAVASLLKEEPRSLWWAIGHLEDATGDDILDQASGLSAENRARIDWLFDNDKYDLALEVRPKSHRKGTTYQAVYGRLKKDRPAPTITTGFMTPGRGRYTHPTRRRVLTPREAARLQGFPETYCFAPDPSNPPARTLLAKWIGDAVPMPLGYAAALSALAAGFPSGYGEFAGPAKATISDR